MKIKRIKWDEIEILITPFNLKDMIKMEEILLKYKQKWEEGMFADYKIEDIIEILNNKFNWLFEWKEEEYSYSQLMKIWKEVNKISTDELLE